ETRTRTCDRTICVDYLEVCWRSILFFFFSSRRRHTRLQGDWSSTCALPISIFLRIRNVSEYGQKDGAVPKEQEKKLALQLIESRSEERRVGKECRSRWSAYHEKKK